jgi:DNA-binding NarL/FixJ family response regulator
MRILIADDHAIVREGLCSLLKVYEDLEVCGEASNREEAIQRAIELQPHLVILDVTMPVLNGFRAAKKINELMPEVPILMLSMHDGEEMVRIPRLAGASGFVTKTGIGEVLLQAINTLAAGKTFFPNGNRCYAD